MRGEPGGHRIGRAHREDVDDTASLQIDEDRPVVVLAFLLRPVIEADDLEDAWRERFCDGPLQHSKRSTNAVFS
jgi:hypothetical protein